MNTMKIDQKYGHARIEMLIKHWQIIKNMFNRGHYSYHELIISRASMLGSIYRKRKAKGKM